MFTFHAYLLTYLLTSTLRQRVRSLDIPLVFTGAHEKQNGYDFVGESGFPGERAAGIRLRRVAIASRATQKPSMWCAAHSRTDPPCFVVLSSVLRVLPTAAGAYLA